MAVIEKRGPNKWRVGIRTDVADGRRWIRKNLTFPPDMPAAEQRTRAEIEGAMMELEYQREKRVDAGNITLADFAKIWLDQHVVPNCAPTTRATYTNFLELRILPQLGTKLLYNITPIMITDFLTSLREDPARSSALHPDLRKRKSDRDRPPKPPRPLSDSTVHHYFECLSSIFAKAVQWQYLRENPMLNVSAPTVRKKPLRHLDDQDAARLLQCLAQEDSLPMRCAVSLALLCGLRLSEVCALSLQDIDWQRSTISVRSALKYAAPVGAYVEAPKTAAGLRVITLPPGMMDLLSAVRDQQLQSAEFLGDRWRGCGRIICAWDGSPINHDTPSKWFRRFADRNGFQGVRFHDLRHTHATLLFAHNLDPVAVAARLGHESPATTLRIYAHAVAQRDQASADAMQSLLESAAAPPAPAEHRGDTPTAPDPPPENVHTRGQSGDMSPE